MIWRMAARVKYAAGALANLTFESEENCECVRAAGGVAALVELLTAGVASETGGAAGFCIDALRNMSRGGGEAVRDEARLAGVFPPLVLLLRLRDAPLARSAAAALRNLTSQSPANRDALREAGGIPPLVDILRAGGGSEVLTHVACTLRNLARSNAPNRRAIREAGAIPLLVQVLRASPARDADGAWELTSQACAALANLCFEDTENADLVRAEGGVTALMGVLGTSTDISTFASAALANIANPLPRLSALLCPPGRPHLAHPPAAPSPP